MSSEKRVLSMDLLRIVACIMVIIIHVSGQNWEVCSPDMIEWKVFNVFNTISRSSVPLFFMISGKFFLEREVNMKRMFTGNILRLLVLYAVWSVLYAIELVGLGALKQGNGWDNFFFYLSSGKYHLWFLPVMIAVYMLLPVLKSLADYENGKYLKYVMVLFFIFSIVKPTIQTFITSSNVNTLLNKFNFELYGYAGYFLLGYYLSKTDLINVKKRYLLLGIFITELLAIIINERGAVVLGEPVALLNHDFSVIACLEAVLLFWLFLKISSKSLEKLSKPIIFCSKCTLGVYLFHVYVLEHLAEWYGINTLSYPAYISVPLITGIVGLCCFAVIGVLQMIPIVNKWFV